MRILVATDLSEPADEAVRQAHARMRGDDVLGVCFVMPHLQPITPLFPQVTGQSIVDVAGLEPRMETAVRERVASLTGRAADAFEVFVDQGIHYAEIVRRAKAWNADLVVVGSHGRTGLARVLLGSVAERVARYVHGPVLVARAGDHHGPVVAATDLSDASLPAIIAGRDEAARAKTDLVVVHAVDAVSSLPFIAGVPFGFGSSLIPPNVVAQIEDAARTVLATAMKTARAEGEAHVVVGDPTAVIITQAEARDARLIVVATRGRTGLSQIALGSVAERVARTAPCSVLVERLVANA